jgi:hypothetical protein
MNRILWLIAAAIALSAAGAASAGPRKERTPRARCRVECRKDYRKCMRRSTEPATCFRDRRRCYRACRQKYPQVSPQPKKSRTPPAQKKRP